MDPVQAFGIRRGDVVAFVGAGGKTTAMFRLADELAAQGLRVVTTTTTRLAREEAERAPERLIVRLEDGPPQSLPALLEKHRHIFVYTRPAELDKVRGVSEAWLSESLKTSPGIDVVLVEADGSRRLPLKAPYPHEPALPSSATLVVPSVGLNVLGQPLDSKHVYGAELIQAWGGLPAGVPVNAELVASVLADTGMGLKSIPEGARVVPLLNRVTAETLDKARAIARRLLAEPRIAHVVIGAMAEERPVWEVRRRVSGIVLAAGQSKRMGRPKLLLPWRGEKSIIRQVCERAAANDDLQEVLVITGAHHESVAQQVADLPVRTIFNPRYAEGEMLSSLQTGLAALAEGQSNACLVMLGDQPGVEPETIGSVLAAYAQGRGPIIAPTFRGQRGHPILIDRAFWGTIMALPPGSAPRDALRAHPDAVCELPVETETVLQDIDTPEDYGAAKPGG